MSQFETVMWEKSLLACLFCSNLQMIWENPLKTKKAVSMTLLLLMLTSKKRLSDTSYLGNSYPIQSETQS